MRKRWTERIKGIIRPIWYRLFSSGKDSFDCPICNYIGPFKDKRISKNPNLLRLDSKCPRCGGAERHRIQYLVIKEVLKKWDCANKSILHIAPEFCLQPLLKRWFEVYHSADLFAPNVDFKEDIQKMSFPNASYDCVMVSHVLMIPPNLESAIIEIRRVLKPTGFAILTEPCKHGSNVEYAEKKDGHSRQMGFETFANLLKSQFCQVEHFDANCFSHKYQLANKTVLDRNPIAQFTQNNLLDRMKYEERVAVCRVG